jgi:hypothetical protein
MIICSWNGGTLTVESESSWYLKSDTYLYGVGIADLDLDGTVEIAVGGNNYSGSRYSGVISILSWSGSGTPQFEKNITWWDTTGAASTYVRGLKISDADRDGMPEILTTGYVTRATPEGQLAIFTWNGVTAFTETIYNFTTFVGYATYLFALEVNDFDSNGVIDILCVGYASNGAGGWQGYGAFFTWNGAVISWLAQFWPSRGNGGNTRIYCVTTGDIDGDGTIEIILGGTYVDTGLTYGLMYIVYRASGTYFETQYSWRVANADTYEYGIGIGDPDRDGTQNIITTGYTNAATASAFLEVWDYPAFSILYEKVWYNASSTIGYALAICDVDQDGTIEMIVAGYNMQGQYRGDIWIWRLGVPEFGYEMLPILVMSVAIPFILVERKRRKSRKIA